MINYVERAMQGDVAAFEQLVIENKEIMYKLAILVLKNEDDACDAIQDALIKIYKNIKQLQDPHAFKTWSRRIVLNSCYDIIKKNKKVVDITEKMTFNYDECIVDSYDCEDETVGILNQLDKDLKLTAIMYYYDEMSVNEIAETLRIPTGTVKSRLSRAREKLYKILKDKE